MEQSNHHRRVDSPTYLLVTVAILLECDLEKLQLIMQAAVLAQTFSPMHQGGKYGVPVGWMVVKARV
jgi:hypothetical protein